MGKNIPLSFIPKSPAMSFIKKPTGKPVVPATKSRDIPGTQSWGRSPDTKATGIAGVGIPTKPLPPPALTYTYGGAKDSTERNTTPMWIDTTGTIAPLNGNQKQGKFPVPAIPSQSLKDNLLLTRTIASNNPYWLGFYNPETKTSFSKTKISTAHEHAHHMDEVLRYPSQSYKFNTEIIKYPVLVDLMNKLRKYYKESEISGEMYSNLWTAYNNNIEDIPKPIRVFFTEEWESG
jgi:hypothetical protein